MRAAFVAWDIMLPIFAVVADWFIPCRLTIVFAIVTRLSTISTSFHFSTAHSRCSVVLALVLSKRVILSFSCFEQDRHSRSSSSLRFKSSSVRSSSDILSVKSATTVTWILLLRNDDFKQHDACARILVHARVYTYTRIVLAVSRLRAHLSSTVKREIGPVRYSVLYVC